MMQYGYLFPLAGLNHAVDADGNAQVRNNCRSTTGSNLSTFLGLPSKGSSQFISIEPNSAYLYMSVAR